MMPSPMSGWKPPQIQPTSTPATPTIASRRVAAAVRPASSIHAARMPACSVTIDGNDDSSPLASHVWLP